MGIPWSPSCSFIFRHSHVNSLQRFSVLLCQEGHPLDSSCYRLIDSRLCYGQELRTPPSSAAWTWKLLDSFALTLTSILYRFPAQICAHKNYAKLRCGLWPQTQFQVDSFPAFVKLEKSWKIWNMVLGCFAQLRILHVCFGKGDGSSTISSTLALARLASHADLCLWPPGCIFKDVFILFSSIFTWEFEVPQVNSGEPLKVAATLGEASDEKP